MPVVNTIHIAIEIWGVIFCVFADICVLSGVQEEPKSSIRIMELLACNGIILAGDALAWLYRGNETVLGYYMVRISNFCVFAFTCILYYILICYLENIIESGGEKFSKRLSLLSRIVCIVMLVLLVISQFNHMFYYFDAQNFYHRTSLYPVLPLFGVVGMVLVAIGSIRHKTAFTRLEYMALLSYLILPIIGLILLALFYGISYLNLTITISGLLIFVVHMVERSQRMARRTVELAKADERLARTEAELAKKEMKLIESKTSLLLGQIRPHFVYNCMSIIRGMCVEDPPKAIEMLDHFSRYLRDSMEFMDRERCLPLKQELKLVDNYLYMEQQRFPDSIEVQKDIEVDFFEVPPLSVQPIVENAVKHGIRGKRTKGIVRIATRKEKENYVITISDDGVGFDPSVKKSEGHAPVGLENVARRLEYMAGGHMEVESKVGQGTKVSIFIPRQQYKKPDAVENDFAWRR